MSVVATPLMSAEEFFEFCHRPENQDRHFELERGRIVEMPLAGERHGVVCGNAAGILWALARQRKRGHVCTNNSGLIVERDPDTVRGADVTLYDDVRRYEDLNPKYSHQAPTLLVEVMSPNDKPGKTIRRVYRFLAMGVSIVWVLDPEDRTLDVFRRGQEPVELTADQEVTGEDVLPDLRCKVADFFAMPGE
jgi:Uma2 family endonuclease